ncbi:hypothetical protein AP15_04063, partial [Mycobacterium tuberculosis M2442]
VDGAKRPPKPIPVQ